jgi:hypothetical protein
VGASYARGESAEAARKRGAATTTNEDDPTREPLKPIEITT